MPHAEFVLKTMPPRLSKMAIGRPRFAPMAGKVFDMAALAVVAPAGFGKTTLLLQWREQWLQQGERVAWISVDAQDEPARFAALLLHALQGTAAVTEHIQAASAWRETLTALLAEVANSREQTILMIDDAERLPAASVTDALQYLLHNAPANLHLVLGSRVPLSLHSASLEARNRFIQLSVRELRLSSEESLAIIGNRFGKQLNMDVCMRLHTAAEGWPIALQLALAVIERESDPAAAARMLSASRGTVQEYFADSMRAAFCDADLMALIRLSVLDRFNAELGELVAGAPITGLLQTLARETPILIEAGSEDWYRLHPLARDYLHGLFEQEPEQLRIDLHARASHWYIGQNYFHEAAAHALAAGDHALAQTHAKYALFSLGAQGRVEEAQEWLLRMPELERSEDPEVRLSVAVTLGLSDRNMEGYKIADAILGMPEIPDRIAAAALRVASTAAVFSDRIGALPRILERWAQVDECGLDPLFRLSRMNISAFAAFHAGETVQARAILAAAVEFGSAGQLRLAAALGKLIVSISHLRDGHTGIAEQQLRSAMQEAEQQRGYRDLVASLLASSRACALVRLGQPAQAQLLLADRLDIIERHGFPENILHAYLALVQAAHALEDEDGALAALNGLEFVAIRRQLPRLHLYAIAGRIRLLAQTAGQAVLTALLQRLQLVEATLTATDFEPLRAECSWVAAVARAEAALAMNNLEDASRQLDLAESAAVAYRGDREMCLVKLLRAGVARQRGDAIAGRLLREAIATPVWKGNSGLLAEVPPQIQAMAGESMLATLPVQGVVAGVLVTRPDFDLLTPKEFEILRCLEQGMSNKRIAMLLGVGGETVKWHLKNLFSKLAAGSREHAVDRARLLGLLGAAVRHREMRLG